MVDVHDTKSVELLRRATGLDLGESEAIIYTDDSKADLLLMDEAKGRKIAQQVGLAVMGTIGILMSAYEEKIISKDEIRSYIGIMKESGRHIGENLYGKSLDEEEKIGTYFKKLDNLKTLHQRKCEELKTLKKYMLQTY